jgi:hypothetical protein
VARYAVERLMRPPGQRVVRAGRAGPPPSKAPVPLNARRHRAVAGPGWVAGFTEVATRGRHGLRRVRHRRLPLLSRRLAPGGPHAHQPGPRGLQTALSYQIVHRGQAVHHSDHGSWYLYIRCTTTFANTDLTCSARTVGDCHDEPLAGTVNSVDKGRASPPAVARLATLSPPRPGTGPWV